MLRASESVVLQPGRGCPVAECGQEADGCLSAELGIHAVVSGSARSTQTLDAPVASSGSCRHESGVEHCRSQRRSSLPFSGHRRARSIERRYVETEARISRSAAVPQPKRRETRASLVSTNAQVAALRRRWMAESRPELPDGAVLSPSPIRWERAGVRVHRKTGHLRPDSS